MSNVEVVERRMADNQEEVEIEVFAGKNSTGPVFEKVHARKIDESIYELLSSPGFTLNLAMGDVISIKHREAPAQVLKRGGNFCIQIYSDHMPEEYVEDLAHEVKSVLGGFLDGRYMGNLSLTVPASSGMENINAFFDQFTEKTGVQWYYSNIYKNLENEEDETLLYWWLDN